MKVKDIERTANVAWSPLNQYPIHLAAGTAAQQLDASFSTNAALEVYSLNLSEPGVDTELKVSVPSDHRFHKIVWGDYGKDTNGTIVGGCDGGIIQIYNVSKLIAGENGLVASTDKHTGAVNALDFNPFQGNLLATGASDSEIYIWDLNNTNAPMSPGVKSQPFEDVVSIAWNKQVQHILASTFASKCVVWDLRKNEPIIKLTDTVSRIRWKVVAWHPEIATQLCLASEDDHAPIIQLWDLRFATSPLKTFENHQRGVLSLAWCQADPDLLISCAKDNRILCWNPNSNNPNGEVLAEVAKTNQWNFDVAWCPRNPALVACSNFDGHVTVYSLLGGKTAQVQTIKKIADSFPGMVGYMETPVMQESVTSVFNDLTKPPKWFKKSVGASFGFGGKLVTFENDLTQLVQQQLHSNQQGNMQSYQPRYVYISQLVTEEHLVTKSIELEQALQCCNYSEYCSNKAESITDQHKRYIWYFLRAYFMENTREELLNLLGYKTEDVNSRLKQFINGGVLNNDVDDLADQFSNLNQYNFYDYDDDVGRPQSVSPEKHWSNSLGSQVSNKNSIKSSESPFKIKTEDDTDGLITLALLLGNTEAAVELCFQAKRYADAIIIAMTGGPDLLAKTQYKYLEKSEGYVSSLISAVVSEDWSSVTSGCDVSSWKEALVALLTHSSNEELPVLCEQLANRLEAECKGDPKLSKDAQLCYICAGDFERLVASWSDVANKTTENLQELVELVTFLQKAVERQGRTVEITGNLADLLSRYAMLLASQGRLSTALNYLGSSQNEKVSELRNRLHVALGQRSVQCNVNQQQQNPRKSISGYQSHGSYNNITSPTNQYASPSSQFSASSIPNQFASPAVKSTPNNMPWQPQPQAVGPPLSHARAPTPKILSPASSGPPQPVRPASAGSSHGDSGIRSRNKYVLDPSVNPSNSYYSPTPYGSNSVSSAPLFNTYNFQSDALASSTNKPLHSQPLQHFSPDPIPQNAPLSSAAPFQTHSLNNTPLTSQPLPQGSLWNPAGDYNQPEVGQPAISAMNSLPPTAAPGWNDPPLFNKVSRMQSRKIETPNQDPITHPLYGSVPVQQSAPADNFSMMPSQSASPYNSPISTAGIYNPVNYSQNQANSYEPQPIQAPIQQISQPFIPNPQQLPAQPLVPPTLGYNTQPMGQNTYQQISTPEVPPPQPEPIQKLPIPEEHQQMQIVLEGLRNQCSVVANNPQTKRKLDEVARKLEILYDFLRDQKLSPSTLASLHELIKLIELGDYMSGLRLHTQMVSGSDFSQIAGFMPGLKVLIQCAMQLQVYLR